MLSPLPIAISQTPCFIQTFPNHMFSQVVPRPSGRKPVRVNEAWPHSHVPVFDRLGADRTGESATWNFTPSVLTGRSNDQERCDQVVIHVE
jgi:hypothetical protein